MRCRNRRLASTGVQRSAAGWARTTGGPDPASAALLLVHAVDGVVHRTVLRPPPGATSESCVEEAVALCLGYLERRGGPGGTVGPAVVSAPGPEA
jgi:hypothetical protein